MYCTVVPQSVGMCSTHTLLSGHDGSEEAFPVVTYQMTDPLHHGLLVGSV